MGRGRARPARAAADAPRLVVPLLLWLCAATDPEAKEDTWKWEYAVKSRWQALDAKTNTGVESCREERRATCHLSSGGEVTFRKMRLEDSSGVIWDIRRKVRRRRAEGRWEKKLTANAAAMGWVSVSTDGRFDVLRSLYLEGSPEWHACWTFEDKPCGIYYQHDLAEDCEDDLDRGPPSARRGPKEDRGDAPGFCVNAEELVYMGVDAVSKDLRFTLAFRGESDSDKAKQAQGNFEIVFSLACFLAVAILLFVFFIVVHVKCWYRRLEAITDRITRRVRAGGPSSYCGASDLATTRR